MKNPKASDMYRKGDEDEQESNESKLIDIKKNAAKKDYSALDGEIRFRHRRNFFLKLLYIIGKNYKLLIRTRTSALVFLLGPLIIMTLVSIGFNTSSLYGVNIASYSEGYSVLSESLVANLSSGEYVVNKIASEQECIDSVKLGSYPVCIVFPKDMAMDNSARNNIMMYIDESRLNIANAISEKLSSKVAVQASQLTSGAVSQILGALDNVNKEMESAKVASTRLASDNIEQVGKLAGVLSKIEEMDFSHAAVDTGVAITAVDSLRTSKNLSSTDVMDVTAGINTIVSGYNSLATKLTSLKETAASAQDEAQTAKNSASGDTAVITDVNTRLGNIKTSVQGVKITNVEAIVSPLKITMQPLVKTKSYFVYILPSLLILLIMLVSLLISSTGVIREKESSAQLRNFITPTSSWLFLVAHYFTYISIIMIQAAIMLGVTRIFVDSIPLTTYLLGMLLMLIFATVFIFIGMFIGSVFNTGESATVASVSVAMITLLFSNAMLPLESLSGFLRVLVEYNPFVMMEGMLKGLFLFDMSIGNMQALYIILGFIAISALATATIQTMREKLMK